jgi:hypothetical protein
MAGKEKDVKYGKELKEGTQSFLIFNSANCLGYYRMFITSAAKRLSI